MPSIRISIAQINTTVGDLEANQSKIISYIEKARQDKSDVIVFPELTVTGYPPEDLLHKPYFVDQNMTSAQKVAEATQDICAVYGFVESQNGLYNSAAIAHNGKLISTYQKQLLPNYGVFDEKRYFTHGENTKIYRLSGVNIGINICEDVWSHSGPIKEQSDSGAELILNINASPYHVNKQFERTAMLSRRAKDNNVHIVYVNMVGGQDELVFDGGSVVLDPEGATLHGGHLFMEMLETYDLDITTRNQVNTPNVERIFISEKSDGITSEIDSTPTARPMDEIEEIYNALVLGTRDYVLKCGFKKVLIALSGGIDSSLVAAIAAKALGPENVIGLSMPSIFSSDGSKSDAKELSENLGLDLRTIEINPIFESFTASLSNEFIGTEWDATEENIQSRIRGNLVMAMSNKFNWLVLTTGNKSEMAVGYATIYGDMAGGFSVIKDVPKSTVYDLCDYINRSEIDPIIPLTVINKPPSAELRPDQKDSDSLPDYSILDPILQMYIEEDMSIESIVNQGFTRPTVSEIIKLVDKNEYKRRQSPPGVKITSKNFGRDRRMPISNRFKSY
jgi:NAD+ synthase (glutamine-hydrolysing)